MRKNIRRCSLILFFAVTVVSWLQPGYFQPVNAAQVSEKTSDDTAQNEDDQDDPLTIVLDPGHGGDQSGAARGSTDEKDLNLKIAEYLKEELEQYENVTVSLTRTGDYDVELEDRTQYSVDKEADVMISLHNNATGECAPYDNGCTVLAAKDGYKDDLAEEEQKLACNILNELSGLGLENQGILLRDSESGDTYDDGTLADYYAIIRGGVLNDIPTVLIEHAFLDDDDDYENYLSSDEKLKSLARADCRGIARYYQLTKKSSTQADGSEESEKSEKSESAQPLEPLENYKEKLVHIVDGHSENNEVSYKVYYADEEQDPGQDLKKSETTEENPETGNSVIKPVTAGNFEDFVRENPPEKYADPLEYEYVHYNWKCHTQIKENIKYFAEACRRQYLTEMLIYVDSPLARQLGQARNEGIRLDVSDYADSAIKDLFGRTDLPENFLKNMEIDVKDITVNAGKARVKALVHYKIKGEETAEYAIIHMSKAGMDWYINNFEFEE